MFDRTQGDSRPRTRHSLSAFSPPCARLPKASNEAISLRRQALAPVKHVLCGEDRHRAQWVALTWGYHRKSVLRIRTVAYAITSRPRKDGCPPLVAFLIAKGSHVPYVGVVSLRRFTCKSRCRKLHERACFSTRQWSLVPAEARIEICRHTQQKRETLK